MARSANDGVSAADRNRKIRQEALRELLANKGLAQQVLEISEKLADLDDELDANKVARLKASADLKLKLVNKYLPDLKQTELIGDPENPLQINPANLSDDQLAAIIANSSSN